MKKLFTLLFLAIALNSFSQSATKYTYAEVSIKYGGSGGHKETSFNIGSDYPVTIENKDEIKKKISTFKDGVDVTNYLADQGWEYLDKQIILSTYVTFYVYTFRKPKQ